MKSERGIVLLIILWVLIALSIIASELAYQIRVEAGVVSNFKEDAKARALAYGGVVKAISALVEDESIEYDSLEDEWANLGEEKTLFGGVLKVEVVDEERKININDASGSILENLKPFNKEVVNAILDWRDVDTKRREGGGAEDDYYQKLEKPYRCKDLFFDTISELNLIKGIITEEENLFEKLKDVLTTFGKININVAQEDVFTTLLFQLKVVEDKEEAKAIAERIVSYQRTHGPAPFNEGDIGKLRAKIGDVITPEIDEALKPHITALGKINVNTADEKVLRACFLGVYGADATPLAEDIVELRKEKPFKSVRDLIERLIMIGSITHAREVKEIKPYLTVRSTQFTIKSVGVIGKTKRWIRSVVMREQEEDRWLITISAWDEGVGDVL